MRFHNPVQFGEALKLLDDGLESALKGEVMAYEEIAYHVSLLNSKVRGLWFKYALMIFHNIDLPPHEIPDSAKALSEMPIKGLTDILALKDTLEIAEKDGLAKGPYADFYAGALAFYWGLFELAQSFKTLIEQINEAAQKGTTRKILRGVCPYCFEIHPVVDGVMLYHDFQENSGDVVSCEGVKAPPYELTQKGVEASLKHITSSNAKALEKLTTSENWDKLETIKDIGHGRLVPSNVGPSDPEWTELKAAEIKRLQALILSNIKRKEFLTEKLHSWTERRLQKS